MPSSFWYPWNPGDYLRDTMHLTRDQHGGYQLLLHAYYGCGHPLKNDDDSLAAITKCTLDEWIGLRPVMEPFFIVLNGLWRHKRADQEIHDAMVRHDRRKAAGGKGGRPSNPIPNEKHGKHSLTNAKAMLKHPTPTPTDTIQEKRKSDVGSDAAQKASKEYAQTSERFLAFWGAYPARRGKKLEKTTTATLFASLTPSCQSSCVLAAKHYAESERVCDGVGIKDPKRFLKDGFWKEYIEPEQATRKRETESAATRKKRELLAEGAHDG